MSDTQHFDEWTAKQPDTPYVPREPSRLLEMFAWSTRYGSVNCWSGTTGEAATMIRELLRERIGLKEQIERLEDERDKLSRIHP